MKILGIDPGFDRLGLAVVQSDTPKPRVLWSDCVIPPKGAASERLAAVCEAVLAAIAREKPDAIALETLFFSTNKKTALQVAEARGAILVAVGSSNVHLYEYTPNQIKVAVTGNGSADKAALARMIPMLVELSDKKRIDDELDAIAIALTCLATERI